MSDDTILFVDHLSMRFGGIVAVNDLSFAAEWRAQRADARLRPDPARPDRPSWRSAERHAIDLARSWLERVGLLDRTDDAAGNLPYGDQRRLEITRAMCTDPALLCLDGPAAGLNARESAGLGADRGGSDRGDGERHVTAPSTTSAAFDPRPARGLRQDRGLEGRRSRDQPRRDRRPDRRQRGRQVDADDDDLRQAARPRGSYRVRWRGHHRRSDASDRGACGSRNRRRAGGFFRA